MPTLQALLNEGDATRACTVELRGGHLIVARLDEIGPDQRFRLYKPSQVLTIRRYAVSGLGCGREQVPSQRGPLEDGFDVLV